MTGEKQQVIAILSNVDPLICNESGCACVGGGGEGGNSVKHPWQGG